MIHKDPCISWMRILTINSNESLSSELFTEHKSMSDNLGIYKETWQSRKGNPRPRSKMLQQFAGIETNAKTSRQRILQCMNASCVFGPGRSGIIVTEKRSEMIRNRLSFEWKKSWRKQMKKTWTSLCSKSFLAIKVSACIVKEMLTSSRNIIEAMI